jgi:hypothetical protein
MQLAKPIFMVEDKGASVVDEHLLGLAMKYFPPTG